MAANLVEFETGLKENRAELRKPKDPMLRGGIADPGEVRATFATERYLAGLLLSRPAQWHLQTSRLQAKGDTGILFDSSDVFIISTYCINFF